MRRQGIVICLNQLKEIEKEIKAEIKQLKKQGINVKVSGKLGVMFPIVNYPTRSGKRNIYCSDTWQFEEVKRGEKN